MKNLITFLLISINTVALATDYFVSSGGSDSADGRKPSTPWRTLERINSEFQGFKPGDRILFNRGDIFRGKLKISRSGSQGNHIVIGAYGTGPNPVISGFTSIREWNKHDEGIYSSPVTCESKPNMVTVNGVNTPIGRWPNKEFLTIDSHVSNKSITDADLSSSMDWTGSEVVIRKNAYIWDRNIITDRSGKTLNYSTGSYYEARDGYGYFIQNDIKTLDQQGEWYYDGKVFYKYFGKNNPYNSTVNVSTIDQLVYLDNVRHITFENISFEGANVYALQIRNSGFITIMNCTINFTGGTAIYGPWWGASPYCRIINTIISNSNGNGINLNGDHNYATITGNSVINTGLIVGMGGSGDGTYNAISSMGNDGLIQFNTIENSGYMGINFGGNNTIVKNNFINNFNLVKNDGGGIYTYVGTDIPHSDQNVISNIVLNGSGFGEGVPDKNLNAVGIYIDDRAKNITITGNTVAFCSTAGIYLHNAHEIVIEDNIAFDNGNGNRNHGCQVLFVHDNYSPDDPIRNIEMRKNIFIAKQASRKIMSFSTTKNDISEFGISDHNYYISSEHDTKIFRLWEKGWNGPAINLSLAEWQMKTNEDYNSKLYPIFIADIKDIRFKNNPSNSKNIVTLNDKEIYPFLEGPRFEYNSSNTTKIILLNEACMDVRGSKYEHYIELLPYSSIVLFPLIDLN